MKRTKGITTAELLVGILLTSMLFLMSLSLFSMGMGSYRKTDARLEMSQKLSLSLRKITQQLHSAVWATISVDSKTVTFQLPLLTNGPDATTGEREYVNPIQADGVNRTFYVSGSNLYYNDGVTGAKTIAKNISATDPDIQSAYYNAPYPVFTFCSVGSTRGLTIMVIARRNLSHGIEFVRMSTSVYFRNMP